VGISSRGRMRWSHRWTEDEVDYDGPYRFRFQVQGHGTSHAVRALVIYGE
jgi:hypothetical protein